VQLRLAILAVAIAATPALAYPTGEQFDQDALTNDGGGGIAFDGSPRWANHNCEVCHTGAPHLISLALDADHPELFTDGWVAAKQYHLRVVLLDEWAGLQYTANGADCGQIDATPFKPCNDNGFSLELDDGNDQPTGMFAPVVADACSTGMPAAPITYFAKSGAALHEQLNGRTSWDLCWTAPAAGTGTITAYLAVVDGNGGTGSAAFPNDTINDDVAAGAVPIAEAGATPSPQVGGCNAAGDGTGLGVALVILFAIKRRRLLAALALASAATACVHVRPRQRETLAHRNMTFAPDPAEDELDLHMQESREGSSGGYGSSGGGCGCN
jgi:hypothetical protein